MFLLPIKKVITCQLLLILLLPVYAFSAEPFVFYTYHNKPPYFFGEVPSGREKMAVTGIYQAFVNYINTQQSALKVTLEFQPRIRLENQLNSQKLKGAILGVNPLWFKDKAKTKFHWSAPFMQDRDVLVVKTGNQFDYAHPRDLVGRSLALPRGLYFWGVTERIKEGKITAFETNSDLQNLGMVEFGRVDATILSVLSARYFLNDKKNASVLTLLKTPHDAFARMVLFPKSTQSQYQSLKAAIEKSLTDPAWVNQLAKWGYR